MKIGGIIWLRNMVDKIASKHHVETYEVEEVFVNKPKFRFVEKGEREGEDVYLALGQTNAGQYLVCAFHLQKDERSIGVECQKYGEKGEEAMWQKVNPRIFQILAPWRSWWNLLIHKIGATI